jgi:thiamine-monophosphate kinase
VNEFDLIRLIRRAAPAAGAGVALGIGDDAAVLRMAPGYELAITTDTLVQGVHYLRSTPAADLGWKALAVNLSDLAAMGAEPQWALVALTMPAIDPARVRDFLSGFFRLARRHQVALVGGDTTRGPPAVTITALGRVPAGSALRRDGARIGDAIYVSGTPGDAAAGLAISQRRLRGVRADAASALRARLDRPTPRVALGLALRGVATAAIDVSDGLAQDLGHVLRASGLGATLDAGALPTSRALRVAVGDDRRRHGLQLGGGDDYELLFTVPPRREEKLRAIAARLRVPMTPIGRIVAGRGLAIRDSEGKLVRLKRGGYDHFA